MYIYDIIMTYAATSLCVVFILSELLNLFFRVNHIACLTISLLLFFFYFPLRVLCIILLEDNAKLWICCYVFCFFKYIYTAHLHAPPWTICHHRPMYYFQFNFLFCKHIATSNFINRLYVSKLVLKVICVCYKYIEGCFGIVFSDINGSF